MTQITDFINNLLDQGKHPDDIVKTLVQNKWKKMDAEKAVYNEFLNKGQGIKTNNGTKEEMKEEIREEIKEEKKKPRPRLIINLSATILLIIVIIIVASKPDQTNTEKPIEQPISTTEPIQEPVQQEEWCNIGEIWQGIESEETLIIRKKEDYGGRYRCHASPDSDPEKGYYFLKNDSAVFKIVEFDSPFEDSQKVLGVEKVT